MLLDCLRGVQFWIKDANGRYLRVNQTFQLDYSLTSMAEANGKTDHDLSPPWIAEAFRADDSLVLRGQRIVNRIELISGYDRVLRWYQTNKLPLRNHRGDFVATAGIAILLPDLKGPSFPLPQLAPALEVMQDETKAVPAASPHISYAIPSQAPTSERCGVINSIAKLDCRNRPTIWF